jgi:ATP-dependent DNA ligase
MTGSMADLTQANFKGLAISIDTSPMEAKLVDSLPTEPGWQYEPKWDGFRCLAFGSDGQVELRAKSGKSLTRYFPDVAAVLAKAGPKRFVLDGELVIPVGDRLSFNALQLRLHPAESRVRKLAAESPALLILFDCLVDTGGKSLIEAPLSERRAALEYLFAAVRDAEVLRLTPYTRSLAEARRWFDRVGGALDGIVAKRVEGPYRPGKRDMLKVKRLRTADCVVGGFRYEADSKLVGSLLLGLYDREGKLDHVGFTSAIADADRLALTRKLRTLIQPPGFTGDAPGGPSRWSTERTGEWEPLRPELVVEVRYDHVTGNRFRHGTALLRWRPDKAPRHCTFEQLEKPARPGRLIEEIVR